jgi:hypothetical protein
MRLATRMQVLELSPVMCNGFCIRKKRNAAMWLQEEEYSEWVLE